MVNATRGKHLGDVGVDTQLSKVDSETMGAQFLILMPCPVFRSDEKWTWTGVWASFVLGLPHPTVFDCLQYTKILQSDQKL